MRRRGGMGGGGDAKDSSEREFLESSSFREARLDKYVNLVVAPWIPLLG